MKKGDGKMKDQRIGIPIEGFAEFTKQVVHEGTILLKNENQMLPLRKNEKISVFGRALIEYYRSGTGSGGAVNVTYTTNPLGGFRKSSVTINEDVVQAYETWLDTHPFDNGGGGWAAEPWNQAEMPLTAEFVKQSAQFSEKAIFILGRTAGEDKDSQNVEGSFKLTSIELENIELLCQMFSKVAIIFNVANIIDMAWIEDLKGKESIQAMLYAWQGGMEGGNALVDVIVGDAYPSGKLSDTIAKRIEDYSSTNNFGGKEQVIYQEDIYVGYRYFETFYPEKVLYPFGFGLGYTTFELAYQKGVIKHVGRERTISVEVTVTNTGSYAGKEVVQLYVEAPQGLLGRPKKILVGFQKTKELQRGESQIVLLDIPFDRCATFDDSGITGFANAYVLEAGDYLFHVGTDIKNTTLLSIDGTNAFSLLKTELVEACQEALAPKVTFQRFKPGKALAGGYYEVAEETVPTQTVSMQNRIEAHLPVGLPITGDKGITLKDVASGKAELDTFLAQLNEDDLATLVRGEGMGSPRVTPGTASAFGGVSERLADYGIPVACCADGPSGIRMDSGLKSTQVPIGSLLASTWNPSLIEELYQLEGLELVRNQIDTLLGPGINIHRHPLNGRNFEYYSEDPLLTGTIAKAVVAGIRSAGSHATIKHFACNNQEAWRSLVDAVVSQRAVREIYLKAFEIVVKSGHATSIMTSYNPINGIWAASNYDLNTTILRNEWGYDGIVMTDWWAKMNDPVIGGEASAKDTRSMVRSQNDLYMVVNNYGAEINANTDNTLEMLQAGKLSIGELQRAAKNICKFLLKAPVFFREADPKLKEITKYAPAQIIFQGAIDLEKTSKVAISTDAKAIVNAKKGIYHIIARIKFSQTNLHQAASSLTINGEDYTTVQTKGTDGEWITQKLKKFELEDGCYEFILTDFKAGIVVDYLEFMKQEK